MTKQAKRFSLFRRNKSRDNSSNSESKSSLDCYNGSQSFYGFLCNGGNYDLAAYQALRYFNICAPVFSAVDLICSNAEHIIPHIYNKKDLVIIDERFNELLKLLKWPNADKSYSDFIYYSCAYNILTGNTYWIASGKVDRPPLEIFAVQPQAVTITVGNDGYAQTYTYNYQNISIKFNRKTVNGKFRYYDSTGKYELYHAKRFSACNNLYGSSKLMALYFEIEQYIKTGLHNVSMLDKGGRPSGLIFASGRISDDQVVRLQAQINNHYAGAENAGRIGLIDDASQYDYRELGKTAKDMDFKALRADTATMIYNTLRIPLPMMSAAHSTMNNMEISKLDLYDNAILPLISRMFLELTNFLMPRYTDDTNIVIFFDDTEIPALEPRRNEELNKLKNLGALTLNEIRNAAGYESIDNGDFVYAPANLVPIASEESTVQKSEDISIRERFLNIMKLQVDADGNPKYSEEELEEVIRANGL